MARRRLTREFSIDLGGEEDPVTSVTSSGNDRGLVVEKDACSSAADDDKGKTPSRGLMQALRGRIRKLRLGDGGSGVAKLALSDEQVKIEIGHELGSHEESLEETEEDILLDVSHKELMSIEAVDCNTGGDVCFQSADKKWREDNVIPTIKEEEPRQKIGFRRRIMQCRLFRSFSIENKTTNFTPICDTAKETKESRRNSAAPLQGMRPAEWDSGADVRRKSIGNCNPVVRDPNSNVPPSWNGANAGKQKSLRANGDKPRGQLTKTTSLSENSTALPYYSSPAQTERNLCQTCLPPGSVGESANECHKAAKLRKIQVAPSSKSTVEGREASANIEIASAIKTRQANSLSHASRVTDVPMRQSESLTEGLGNSSRSHPGKILPPLRSYRSADMSDSINIITPLNKEKRKRDSLIDEYSLFKGSPPTKFPEVRPRSKTMPCRPPELLTSSSPKLDSKPPKARSPQNLLKDSPHLSPQSSPGISPRSPREPMKAKPLPIDLPDKDNIVKFSRHSLIFPFSDSSSLESNDGGGRSPGVAKSCLKASAEKISSDQKSTKKVSWSPDLNHKRPALFRTYSLDNSNPTSHAQSSSLRKSSSSTTGSVDRMFSPRRLLNEKQRVAAFEDCLASQH